MSAENGPLQSVCGFLAMSGTRIFAGNSSEAQSPPPLDSQLRDPVPLAAEKALGAAS